MKNTIREFNTFKTYCPWNHPIINKSLGINEFTADIIFKVFIRLKLYYVFQKLFLKYKIKINRIQFFYL